jgi:hypothetical protein
MTKGLYASKLGLFSFARILSAQRTALESIYEALCRVREELLPAIFPPRQSKCTGALISIVAVYLTWKRGHTLFGLYHVEPRMRMY